MNFNLLLKLSEPGYRDVRGLIVGWLDKPSLPQLGVLTGILNNRDAAQPYLRLFESSKAEYFNQTRVQRAGTLRDHVMIWRYEEVEALVQSDPKVLEVRCEYKANRWLDDNEENIRSLSALEYAWWAGDENFIELFERLGAGQLARHCYSKKEDLSAESVTYRSDLAKALNVYADGGGWGDLKPIYYAAPQWVFGMSAYIYYEDIDSPSEAVRWMVFSDLFRVRALFGVRALLCCGEARIVAGYLSKSHPHESALVQYPN